MGLIKEYQSRNQMNFSFDNNDKNQQKLIKKQYDKNAGGLSFNESMQNSAQNAEEMFKPKKIDYSSINDNKILNEQKSDMQFKSAGAGLTQGLNVASTLANMNAGFKAASAASATAKGLDNASTLTDGASKAAKTASGIGKAIPFVQAGIAAAETLETAKKAIKTNDYGEGKTTSSNTLKEFIDMSSPANSAISDWKNSRANGENIVASGGRAVLGSMGVTSIPKIISAGFGKTNEKSGIFGAMNKFTGVTKTHDAVNKQKADIKKANDAENARIAEEKRKYLGREKDLNTANALSNNGMGMVFKKGGKLIPRFRRGGELDLEKENVILDGPSHDDHNETGVKGDKGLPVVKKGVKVAEIESLELVLNKKSSVELEKLAKDYEKTKDKTILDKMGKIMKKEINDNTYDYSKELL